MKNRYWITDRRHSGVSFNFLVQGKDLQHSEALKCYLKYCNKILDSTKIINIPQDSSWKYENMFMRIVPSNWKPRTIDKMLTIK